MEFAIELLQLSDESVHLIKWEGLDSLIIIAFAIICAAISTLSKGVIVAYIKYKAPKARPINKMIVHDTAYQLIAILVITCCVLISLVSGYYLNELFDEWLMWILWASLLMHNISLVTGGFGMAFFRLMMVECPILTQKYISANAMCNLILVIENFIGFMIITLNLRGVRLVGSGLPMEFFRGHTATQDTITMKYRLVPQKSIDSGMKSITIVVMIFQTFLVMEILIYLAMFYRLYKKDQKMTRALSAETIKQRNQRNALTLSGQAISFLVETLTTLTVMSFIKWRQNSILEPASYPIVIICLSTFVSVVQLVTSPELRRFVTKID